MRTSTLTFLTAAALALTTAPAAALSVADTRPLYFAGPGGYGFDAGALAAAGLAPTLQAEADDNWIDAGGVKLGLPIAIEIDLQKVHKNPQARGHKPNARKPIIADSTWTVTNDTGEALEDAVLVFSLGDTSGRKKKKPIALDGNLVEILAYSFEGEDYLLGAVRLGDLAAEGEGSSVSIDVRYIVAGRLPRKGNKLLLPPLGVSGLTGWSAIPEPTTGSLIAVGLLALAARRRC
jgi:hypothetical protein